MAEQIYNVFLFFDSDDTCSEVGYAAHTHSGTDQQGIAMLRERVEADLPNVEKITLATAFTRSEYNARCRLGDGHFLYDEVFVKNGAGQAPLFVATPVVDGHVHFNHFSEHDQLDVNDVAEKLGERGVMIDWLRKYTTEKGFNFSQLIHDDYFLAIKLTFNARLYVSAMKLLASCIDSLAYIEYGDDRKCTPFVKWLDTYADLEPLGITATELWELRNGILHMSNINSSKVRSNKIRRISFRVGGPPDFPRQTLDTYYFDFWGLIQAFAQAQANWIESYRNDRSKFAKFVERYDETISDSRVAITHVGEGGFETTP